jgi:hypothetical protein
MSDMDLEAPDADAAEQNLDAVPDEPDVDEDEVEEPEQLPLEAAEADAAEQARVVIVGDDDDYR